MTYEIHNDIPAPIIVRPGRTPKPTFPFGELEVSQCFLVPMGEDSEKTVLNRVRTQCQRWKKLTEIESKFRIVKFADPVTDEAVIGVWRTA